MGTLIKKELKFIHVVIAFFYVLLLSFSFDFVELFLISLVTLFVLKLFFIKRYGGFSGDIYGFTIEITELVLLNGVLFLS